ncbi:MAG: threonine/serine exporter family protein, partial [Oscillibacter sp.]|nr:threonine/serine exporter family protein [Oscillibacter sp.]
MTQDIQVKVLSQLLNTAELMLSCGAEINRVEDTVTRIGTAYGASQINVFVITSSAVITILFPDREPLTQTRRIRSGGRI